MPQPIVSQFDRKYNLPLETFRAVANSTVRDSIPSNIRWEGMLVYVQADGITYELNGGITNGDWTQYGGIDDAPADGNIYARKDNLWQIITGVITDDVWTPTLIDGGGGATYSGSFSGQYMDLGNFVWINAILSGIATTGVPNGVLQIGGLPFNPGNFASLSVGRFSGSSATFYSVSCLANNVSDVLNFYLQQALDGNLGNPAIGSVTFTSGEIFLSGIYKKE